MNICGSPYEFFRSSVIRHAINLIACASSLLMFGIDPALSQQGFPSKPVRLIIPNPPGGGTDLVGRLVGQRLSDNFGQQVVVDNRAGGNGFIGGLALVKAPPDGHTVMLATTTHLITPLLFPAPYDPITDFSPVSTLIKFEFILVVHSSVPANNLKELIAVAKSRPGQLNYGSSGAGSIPRLAGAFFDIMTGTSMQSVAYKGTTQAMTDLLSGQIQLSFSAPAPTIPYLDGKLKAIAVSGNTRMAALPHVPTFTEAGLPGLDLKSWQGILAPVGTPRGVIDRLSGELTKILAQTDVKAKLAGLEGEPFISTPEQFSELMKADHEKFAKIIRTANIKGE